MTKNLQKDFAQHQTMQSFAISFIIAMFVLVIVFGGMFSFGVEKIYALAGDDAMTNKDGEMMKKDPMVKDSMKDGSMMKKKTMKKKKATKKKMMKKDPMVKDSMKDGSMMKDRTMMKGDTTKKDSGMMDKKDSMMKDGTIMKDPSMMKKGGDTMMKKDGMLPKDGDTMMKKGSYEKYSPEKVSLASSEDRVILFFRASWCPACRGLDADIRANMDKIPAKVTILDLDYDIVTDLKQKYGVTYQHTFVQVDAAGNQISKWAGSATLASLLTNIK